MDTLRLRTDMLKHTSLERGGQGLYFSSWTHSGWAKTWCNSHPKRGEVQDCFSRKEEAQREREGDWERERERERGNPERERERDWERESFPEVVRSKFLAVFRQHGKACTKLLAFWLANRPAFLLLSFNSSMVMRPLATRCINFVFSAE